MTGEKWTVLWDGRIGWIGWGDVDGVDGGCGTSKQNRVQIILIMNLNNSVEANLCLSSLPFEH